MIELTQITIYPVKSCKGMNLSKAMLSPFGLENDRRWMVVGEDGTFLSQRTFPTLALVEPTLTPGFLQLQAPGTGSVEIPRESNNQKPAQVRIWDDSCTATDCGDDAASMLSDFLKVRCRLVSMSSEFSRAVSPKYSTKKDQVGFADAFPLLLISSASLRDLNDRLDLPVPMNRFRPNLVVSGCEPFAEDTWEHVAIGPLTFRVVKPCARCTVPSVDQSTGVAGKEPLTTLAMYRKLEGGKIYFGQNLVNEQKSGELIQGNEVIILQAS
ncbi:MAG TPA: MOSC N-terminal beta barrel domain-containing protein [Bacteroidota bacterium]|nr:MOSC N-terminal beta barrel domain-containing protein [Bacteroidota bacterium]